MLNLADFDYNLPKNLIASQPHEPRDRCKLLVYERENKQIRPPKPWQRRIKHARFEKILNFLNSGDVLVLNDTKVIPARLVGFRIALTGERPASANATAWQGRKFKILLVKDLGNGVWDVLIDGKKRNVGIRINFGSGLVGEILKSPTKPPPFKKGEAGRGIWEMKFNKSGKEFQNLILKIGKMPLPPYIKLPAGSLSAEALAKEDKHKVWYQTVYAKYAGSVAAPTAGLHFTKKLLKKLKQKSVQLEYVTLHVGLGTFMPVRVEDVTKHKMHPEYIEISARTASALNKAKKEGRRIVAVGTTTARALESAVVCHSEPRLWRDKLREESRGRSPACGGVNSACGGATTRARIKPHKGEVNIFIYPPYKFKFVDALVTNFHLPKSTLLMLIAALIGQNMSADKAIKIVKKIYTEAINKNYHFYSYGDAMFVY